MKTEPTRRPTDDQIRELCTITTRDETCRHFTSRYDHYLELEAMGLLSIHRPIHAATGIPYGEDAWTCEVTRDGQHAVDNRPDLHPQS